MSRTDFILWFDQIGSKDIKLVGGKNSSIGEMYNTLTSKGIKVPYGFAITTIAYEYFLEYNKLKDRIKKVIENLNRDDINDLRRKGEIIRSLIISGDYPLDLREAIANSYRKLCEFYKEGNVDVAVRSSATSEDLPHYSFAGQQDTYLNVRGIENIYYYVKRCFASLFTDRAIAYREDHGFEHFDVKMSVGIQKMVRSDLASSGVMFTLHTDSGFEDIIVIEAIYGLGEAIVRGEEIPDEYIVHKKTLKEGYKPILMKKMGLKEHKQIYDEIHGGTKSVLVRANERNKFCLSDEEIIKLAKWGILIEEHYQRPMDIEWAKDGLTNEIYIVQARPETIHRGEKKQKIDIYELIEKKKPILKGIAIGNKIATGKVKILYSPEQMSEFQKGEILVTEITNPDWEPIMKLASAIITEKGGRTSHAAIVSRELGIPAIVGVKDALKVLRDGMEITINCAEGEEGYIYEGILKYNIEEVNLEKLERPKTKIMMNIGNPTEAFRHALIPNDGVGLARMEFIYANWIQIHPLALLNFDKLEDENLKQRILEIAVGYNSLIDFFIYKLAEGIGSIAGAFYPNDVIVRFSDFKSNEYAKLIGGYLFEPKEENPMIGFRGASRYYSDMFKEAFKMEVLAIKIVREEMGLKNVKVMVPFCRTPEEGVKVLKLMEEAGYPQHKNGLEVYVMAEIPSNIILAEEFAQIFDGFSIGSNDLTQLTLGVDRDSALVSHIFDERNKAVLYMIEYLIKSAKKYNKKVGICGQAPSDYPEIVEFLVKCGIDSISLNPDAVLKTTLMVLELERKLL
ncbi:MAG: phosphoenolpyruvate synthase [candidate division WOR-3 bacterium]|mgnify:CR=1 FL=1